jgi:hypothetical protein
VCLAERAVCQRWHQVGAVVRVPVAATHFPELCKLLLYAVTYFEVMGTERVLYDLPTRMMRGRR